MQGMASALASDDLRSTTLASQAPKR